MFGLHKEFFVKVLKNFNESFLQSLFQISFRVVPNWYTARWNNDDSRNFIKALPWKCASKKIMFKMFYLFVCWFSLAALFLLFVWLFARMIFSEMLYGFEL
jgi:hypothetical protein